MGVLLQRLGKVLKIRAPPNTIGNRWENIETNFKFKFIPEIDFLNYYNYRMIIGYKNDSTVVSPFEKYIKS